MHKKRLIFTLLYEDGNFVLSRNFRLQNVGDINWLKNNYDFSHISFSIDELIVLDVSRGERNIVKFCESLKILAEGCFAPITAGGGVTTVSSVRKLLRSGADKVSINSGIFRDTDFLYEVSSEFGEQCIVGSMDVKIDDRGVFQVWSQNGSRIEGEASEWINRFYDLPIGEIYLNSIDRDGTGNGYDFNLLNLLSSLSKKPTILAGGVGNATHLAAGLADSRIDAVATAHLFNFIGSGLKNAREYLVTEGVSLPIWNSEIAHRISVKGNYGR